MEQNSECTKVSGTGEQLPTISEPQLDFAEAQPQEDQSPNHDDQTSLTAEPEAHSARHFEEPDPALVEPTASMPIDTQSPQSSAQPRFESMPLDDLAEPSQNTEETPKGQRGRAGPEESDEKFEKLNSPVAESVESAGPGLYEVVHKNGVLVRAAPSCQAPVLGRLALGQQVCGRTQGDWLQLDLKPDLVLDVIDPTFKYPEQQAAWVLVDGKEIGLGILLDCSAASQAESAGGPERKNDDSLEKSAASPEAEPSSKETTETTETKETKETSVSSREPKVKAAKATKHASMLAERVVEPVEYVVLSPTPLHSEPKFQSEEIGELQEGDSLLGYPGSLSWVRLARPSEPNEETWAPIKSAKGVFLSPKWSRLESEGVFSEALEVSWQGLVARKPYVAAYSIEWRLTPGEELPIGAGQETDREGFKKTGYALSLKPRALVDLGSSGSGYNMLQLS